MSFQNIVLHPFGRLDAAAEAVVIEPIPAEMQGSQTLVHRSASSCTKVQDVQIIKILFNLEIQLKGTVQRDFNLVF